MMSREERLGRRSRLLYGLNRPESKRLSLPFYWSGQRKMAAANIETVAATLVSWVGGPRRTATKKS
jgi:hypothetical protein